MPEPFSLGLIGYPLGHSLSPALHQTALAEASLTGTYSLFAIPPLPEGQTALETLIHQLRRGELQGLNVTIPHKQSVLPLVDDLTPSARAIGAVNTLYMKSGRLIGDNTDAPGFLADISHLCLEGTKVALVLGAGGAARAVVYALFSQGWKIQIAALRPQQAMDLREHFSHPMKEASQWVMIDFSTPAIQQAGEQAHLIVNATSAGMYPNVNECPWPEKLALPKHACFYDLVYNPLETQLIRLAKAAGLPCRNGLGMLVEQAALSFECWTGHKPTRSLMMDTVYKSLMARSKI
ncbi:MAG: shikimate dehydrogenase [Chloroflexi bacterium]|nr:shikimate dehydrogenase [Chloroflexota bacterium]